MDVWALLQVHNWHTGYGCWLRNRLFHVQICVKLCENTIGKGMNLQTSPLNYGWNSNLCTILCPIIQWIFYYKDCVLTLNNPKRLTYQKNKLSQAILAWTIVYITIILKEILEFVTVSDLLVKKNPFNLKILVEHLCLVKRTKCLRKLYNNYTSQF